MAQVVTLQLSPIFRDPKGRIGELRDSILTEGRKILRSEVESSIRLRWYDTGATLNSLREVVTGSDEEKTYSLIPVVTSKRGAPYPLFGEYGWGRRGRATGRPAPPGYRYGTSAGGTARRFTRIAIGIAEPLIESKARVLIANFTV